MALYLDVSAKVMFHCLKTQKWGMKLGNVDGSYTDLLKIRLTQQRTSSV